MNLGLSYNRPLIPLKSEPEFICYANKSTLRDKLTKGIARMTILQSIGMGDNLAL